jgi:hypothetical protein
MGCNLRNIRIVESLRLWPWVVGGHWAGAIAVTPLSTELWAMLTFRAVVELVPFTSACTFPVGWAGCAWSLTCCWSGASAAVGVVLRADLVDEATKDFDKAIVSLLGADEVAAGEALEPALHKNQVAIEEHTVNWHAVYKVAQLRPSLVRLEAPGQLLPRLRINYVQIRLAIEAKRPIPTRRVLSIPVRPSIPVLEVHTLPANPHLNHLLASGVVDTVV